MTNEEFIKSISLEGEIWKDVIGFEGVYMVSSKGRIISCERYVYNGNKRRWNKPKILTQKLTPYGYFSVHLRNHPINVYKLVHRVVSEAFIPNKNNYDQIDHIDGNRQNNDISNLTWCTRLENMNNPITRKRISLGRNNKGRGYKIPVVLISSKGHIFYPSIASASKQTNSCANTISSVCKGVLKSTNGNIWMYLSDYEAQFNKSKNS